VASLRRQGLPLKISSASDPTGGPQLGFAVVLSSAPFQDLGHQVIIIHGDYTTLMGIRLAFATVLVLL